MKFTVSLICLLLIIENAHAGGNEYAVCGPRQNLAKRIFTDAEKIRIACIDDVYKKINARKEKEVQELSAYNEELTKELKKVAYKVDYNIVLCQDPNSRTKPSKDVERCQEIVELKKNIIARIDHLQGWDQMYKPENKRHSPAATIEAPCPSKEELNRLQQIRYFRKSLYQNWERCVSLQPETYYTE